MPTPPRTVATVPKRDGPKPENVGPDADKDDMKRQRDRITLNNYIFSKSNCFCLLFYFIFHEYIILLIYVWFVTSASPRRKPLSPRRRSPVGRRGGSPRRQPDSPRRRPESPPRRRVESPFVAILLLEGGLHHP